MHDAMADNRSGDRNSGDSQRSCQTTFRECVAYSSDRQESVAVTPCLIGGKAEPRMEEERLAIEGSLDVSER